MAIDAVAGRSVFAFVVGSNNRLFAGSENTGLWVSGDGGASFQTYATSLPEMNFDILGFNSRGDTLYAAMYGGGIARSIDGGASWVSFNNGFETQAMAVAVQQLGDTLFAAIDIAVGLQPSGIYKTPIQQDQWQRCAGFPDNLSLASFIITESGVMFVGASLAGARGNVQVSADGGLTWINRNIAGVQGVLSFAADGDTVFAGTTNGTYVTTNHGEA